MNTKLIEMDDGTLIEVQASEDDIAQISGGAADRVDASIDKIKPLLLSACRPIAAVWNELTEEVDIAQAEVTLGIGFEGSGNFFIAQAKTKANLTIKLTLKPKPHQT